MNHATASKSGAPQTEPTPLRLLLKIGVAFGVIAAFLGLMDTFGTNIVAGLSLLAPLLLIKTGFRKVAGFVCA